MLISRYRSLVILLAVAIFGFAYFAYQPGLKGGFVFDDFANLPALGAEGAVHDAASFFRYITSGKADPTGRPLALLSFLLDARDWPANPAPFKRSNLVLHLANGALLALLLCRLMAAVTGGEENTRQVRARHTAAIVAAGIWLLHPLFVSTTLYVVQREAMLACTFVLLGLIAWLRGRELLLRSRRIGLAWMIFGLGVCTGLATLCKANGVLLPALAWAIEACWLLHPADSASPPRPVRHHTIYRQARVFLIVLPTLLVAGYLLYEGWRGLTHGVPSSRPWTLLQRLMTEPRVLVDYLRLLWAPQIYTPGLFNDQIRASTGIFSPPTTLASMALVGLLLLIAWRGRYRIPALATALLFYFVGQSMESSTLGLELYFEHRNYLPAALMFWPLSLWLCGLNQRAELAPELKPTDWRAFKAGLTALLILGLGWMTWQRASLWGDSSSQSLMWARLNPTSPRAQAMAAGTEIQNGQAELARERMLQALALHPDEMQLAFNLADAECSEGLLRVDGASAVRRALAVTPHPGVLMLQWVEAAINRVQQGSCNGLSLAMVTSWLDAAASNSTIDRQAGRRQDLFYLRGRVALGTARSDEALEWFNRSLDAQVRPAAALRQAALLGQAGFPELGLRHLDHYQSIAAREQPAAVGMPRIHAWVLKKQGYWQRDLTHLRATLKSHLTSRNRSP